LNPRHGPSYLNLAQASSALQQWQTTIKYARQAIALQPDQEQAYFYLGIALAQQQQFTDAIAAYSQVLKINPKFAEIYYHLGQTLVEVEKFSEARLCYQKLAKIKPEKEINYNRIGEVFLEKQKYLEAAQYLEISIRYNPEDFWAHHNLGRALCELQQWQWANQILRKAILINQDFAWSYYHLAVALEKQNYLTEATKNYRIFLELEPSVYGYQSLGNILTYQARKQQPEDKLMLEEAWLCYWNGIKVNPDYLLLYYQALELQPNNSELLFLLAEAHLRHDEPEVAIIFYQMGFQSIGHLEQLSKYLV
ncbi:MAG: tetratricopeptide repeat protein, partial [Xenococcus sp. (in: cyanobacteria)]